MSEFEFLSFVEKFSLFPPNLFDVGKKSIVEKAASGNITFKKIVNEFWTSKQRQSHSIHEISYRACFKPQLPNFFINKLTRKGDVVYDPFSGRGTTVIEAALENRKIIANDINPLSKILSEARVNPPTQAQIIQRLEKIKFTDCYADIDLSMFYHPKTESEIVSLKKYLINRKITNREDFIDKWIRMVATNRLTGHSSGFFSVYTLPPNQAVSAASQIKINEKRKQKPGYRDTKKIIINKSAQLQKDLTIEQRQILKKISKKALFLSNDARTTPQIKSKSIKLLVTSPPFLDVVQYSSDNWLRCWFNDLNEKEIAKKITMCKNLNDWNNVMESAFEEFYRIIQKNGWIAFEVGEVRKGKINLEEQIIPLGIKAGFNLVGVIVNEQKFSKTSNIWGIDNNNKGTNSNRIVVFNKK